MILAVVLMLSRISRLKAKLITQHVDYSPVGDLREVSRLKAICHGIGCSERNTGVAHNKEDGSATS